MAEGRVNHRARHDQRDDREERRAEGALQRHPEPAGQQGDHHEPAADTQETGHEAGDGPDPSEDRGRRLAGLAAPCPRVSRTIAIACHPRRSAVTRSSIAVSIEVREPGAQGRSREAGPDEPGRQRGCRARHGAGRRARQRARSGRSPAEAWPAPRSAEPRAAPGYRGSSRCRLPPRTTPRALRRRDRSRRRSRCRPTSSEQTHRSSSAARTSTSRSPR